MLNDHERSIVLDALRAYRRALQLGQPPPGAVEVTPLELDAVAETVRALEAVQHAEIWRRTLEQCITRERKGIPVLEIRQSPNSELSAARRRLTLISAACKLALRGIAPYE